MHINLLCQIIATLLKKLKIKNPHYIIIIFLTIYLFITNFTPSIIRATLLYILRITNNTLKLKINPTTILTITILIILTISPHYLHNLSFQYSALTSFFLTKITKTTKNYISSSIQISLIAFLASLPISINNFYQLNLLSPILNLIFVPLITFIIYPLTLLSYILPPLSEITHIFIFYFENLSLICSKFTYLIITTPKITMSLIIIYYLIILLLKQFHLKHLLIPLTLITITKIYPYFDSSAYIYFLNVGQGDCTLLLTPYRKEVILIDTGGQINSEKELWQIKENQTTLSENLITFFKSINLQSIDYLLITHGDYDHMGEAINLVNNFKVDKVIFNNDEFNNLELELIKVLENKNIPYYQNIKELSIYNNKLYFLNNELYDNENDNSNVIYTKLDDFKFLFMGDAGVEVEEEILNKYNLTDIDILKVGHHGSKTSSSEEFISEINPKYSIISVGKNNRYGHPNNEVLNNLEYSKVYRTDRDGSIRFKIKNNKLDIETCTS